MATNKHATIRYQALDKCFSNFGRKFFIEDLIDACTSAIDRVERFETLVVEFIHNHILDLEDYIDDILSVTINVDAKPERIRLKVDARRYNLISTKPLHHSQKLVNSRARYGIVE